MNAPIVFMDTETLGLDPDLDPIWEFAAIKRASDGSETVIHHFVRHAPDALEKSIERGFPEEFADDYRRRYDRERALEPHVFARVLNDLCYDRPHIVGAVPSFDTERLARLIRNFGRDGQAPGWHYHPLDIENLVVGYLRGRQFSLTLPASLDDFDARPPWDSEALSRAIGVEPNQFARHTALGDVQWGRAMFDAVMGRPR